MDEHETLGVAGVGKMGEALVKGLVFRRVLPPAAILVTDAIPSRAEAVAARYGVVCVPTSPELAERSEILVLASKPGDLLRLVDSVAPRTKRDAVVITLAAGIRTSVVESRLRGRGRVVRMMPNLACGVGEGATALALGATASEADGVLVEQIMGALGRVTRVEESHLDAVTGLSGSGPGFIAALAQAMIEGGMRAGLPKPVASQLALQTMKGTAELLLADGLDPETLYRMVATPGGTTAAGWQVMQSRGVPQAVSDGVVAAAERATELARAAVHERDKGGRGTG